MLTNIVVLQEIVHHCHGINLTWLFSWYSNHMLRLILQQLLVLLCNRLIVGNLLDVMIQPLLSMFVKMLRELLQITSFCGRIAVRWIVRILIAIICSVCNNSPATRLASRVTGRTFLIYLRLIS